MATNQLSVSGPPLELPPHPATRMAPHRAITNETTRRPSPNLPFNLTSGRCTFVLLWRLSPRDEVRQTKLSQVRLTRVDDLGIGEHVDQSGLARGEGAVEGRAELTRRADQLAVAAE